MEKKSPLGTAITYGAIAGIIMILFSLLAFFMGWDHPDSEMYKSWRTIGQVLSMLGLTIIMFFGIKSFRDNVNGGALKYTQGLFTGTLISLVAAVLVGIWTILYMQVLAPDMIDLILEATRDKLEEGNMSDEQIEASLQASATFMKPPIMFAFTLFWIGLLGLIIAAIESIFLRKTPDLIARQELTDKGQILDQ